MSEIQIPTEFITIPEAILLAKKFGVSLSRPTIISYCKEYFLGHQIGMRKNSRWAVDRVHFENFIRGKGRPKYLREENK
jgi:hypothetical protein